MKRTGNILSWLGYAGEHSIVLLAGKHVQETCKTVDHFADAVSAMVKGDLSAKTLAITRVKESERAADKLRAAMLDQLTEDLVLPPDREDLMRFAHNLDKIADWTNSAARLLGFIEAKLPDNILKNMSISTELIVESVRKLKAAIDAMGANDLKTAMENCAEVERLEHEADDQKRTLIDAILHGGLDPASLLVSYNLAESLEGITDRIENASEMLKMLAVKSR